MPTPEDNAREHINQAPEQSGFCASGYRTPTSPPFTRAQFYVLLLRSNPKSSPKLSVACLSSTNLKLPLRLTLPVLTTVERFNMNIRYHRHSLRLSQA